MAKLILSQALAHGWWCQVDRQDLPQGVDPATLFDAWGETLCDPK